MATTTRMKPIEEALSMRCNRSGEFETFILSDYCYGDWAWGGLAASLVQAAAVKFNAEDWKSSHPDVVNMQIQYLRPILSDQTTILIRTVRVTRPILTVHVALTQKCKECVIGYVKFECLCRQIGCELIITYSLSDLRNGKGPSFDTQWKLHPPPTPAKIAELETNTSPDWIRYSTPFTKDGWYRLQSLVYFYLPTKSTLPSLSEVWVTPTDSRNNFTNDTLGMVVDMYPPFMENYDSSSTVNHDKLLAIAKQQRAHTEGKSELSDALHRRGWTSPFITTTLSLTLEVKKILPPGGVKWLFVRGYAKTISQGRYDIEVLILDEAMELVAVSHQVALAAVFRADRRDKSMMGARAKV